MRERNINWLPLTHLQPGTGPATQACAPTGNEPATLRCAGGPWTHWATPVRANVYIYVTHFQQWPLYGHKMSNYFKPFGLAISQTTQILWQLWSLFPNGRCWTSTHWFPNTEQDSKHWFVSYKCLHVLKNLILIQDENTSFSTQKQLILNGNQTVNFKLNLK